MSALKKVLKPITDLTGGGATGPRKNRYAGTILDSSLTPITGKRLRRNRNDPTTKELLGG